MHGFVPECFQNSDYEAKSICAHAYIEQAAHTQPTRLTTLEGQLHTFLQERPSTPKTCEAVNLVANLNQNPEASCAEFWARAERKVSRPSHGLRQEGYGTATMRYMGVTERKLSHLTIGFRRIHGIQNQT